MLIQRLHICLDVEFPVIAIKLQYSHIQIIIISHQNVQFEREYCAISFNSCNFYNLKFFIYFLQKKAPCLHHLGLLVLLLATNYQ